MRAGDRIDERVRHRPAPAIATDHVEARVEHAFAVELSDDGVAPRQMTLACRIDTAVARVHHRAVATREGEALAVDADPLDHLRVGRDVRSVRRGETAVGTAVEVENTAGRDDAAADGLEMRCRPTVEQPGRAVTATAAAPGDDERERRGRRHQPVQPQRPTPP